MTDGGSPTLTKVGALALIIGSIQFVAAQIVEGALLTWGYTPVNSAISDLGNWNLDGNYAYIFNVSIVILGICVFLSLPMIWTEIPRVRGRRRGLVFLAIAGIGAIIVGLYPEETLQFGRHLYHAVGAGLAFLGAGLALVSFSRGFPRSPRWKPLALPTLIGGLVDLVALVAFLIGPTDGTHWVFERIIVAPVLIWAPLVGYWVLTHPRDATQAEAPFLAAA